jgi:hypothetical protein
MLAAHVGNTCWQQMLAEKLKTKTTAPVHSSFLERGVHSMIPQHVYQAVANNEVGCGGAWWDVVGRGGQGRI